MSLNEYWYGETYLVRYYREAVKIRRDRINFESWLCGKYVYEAISRLAPILHPFAPNGTKAEPYLREPILFKDQENKINEEEEQNYAFAWMTNFVRAGKNWNKKGGD